MPTIEVYYLIDFENVHENGLSGVEKLGNHDHVHLFYTEKASKIDIQNFTKFLRDILSLHKASACKRSLDMHFKIESISQKSVQKTVDRKSAAPNTSQKRFYLIPV